MNLLRTFIAINIPVSITLKEVWDDLRGRFDSSQVKWVDNHTLHLTLFFLGDTPEDQVTSICSELRQMLAEHKSFNLVLKGLGFFGNPSSPRVIWVGVERNVQLIALKRDVSRIVSSYGYLDDQRAFNPHITLGRVKNIKNPDSLLRALYGYEDFQFQETSVNGIIHYKSELKPTGPLYTAIQNIVLK